MRCLMLLTLPLLLVMVEAHRIGYGSYIPWSGFPICRELLVPDAGIQAVGTATSACITETTGLQALQETLNATSHQHRRNYGGSGLHGRDLVAPPGAGGYTTEDTALKMCIADKLGFLSGTAFNVTAFKDSLLAKVTGTAILANTQLGLDSCPEAPLVAFDIKTYMHCMITWCATGAAPA